MGAVNCFGVFAGETEGGPIPFTYSWLLSMAEASLNPCMLLLMLPVGEQGPCEAMLCLSLLSELC